LALLKGQSDGRQILLNVAILGSRNPTDLTFFECVALLDTGATSSGIGPRVIRELGLRSHEKKLLSVATEMRMVEYFLFRVGLFPVGGDGVRSSLPFVFAEIDGFSWVAAKTFDVILGMDVLSQCAFTLSRTGAWTLECF
jgi:Aspartyl protease